MVFAGLMAGALADGAEMCRVTIRAEVPSGTGTVYLTGTCARLGDWDPAGLVMDGAGTERVATFSRPRGTELEYKFTLGSWDREGLGPSGQVMPNYRLTVESDTNVTVTIGAFKKGGTDYLGYMADWQGSGVTGRLVYWTNVASKFLDAPHNVEIWLPPDYDDHGTNRYDVLYMQDGQNLFDARLSAFGTAWEVDKAVTRCGKAGKNSAADRGGRVEHGRAAAGIFAVGPGHELRGVPDCGIDAGGEQTFPDAAGAGTHGGDGVVHGRVDFVLAGTGNVQKPSAGRAGCLSTSFTWKWKRGRHGRARGR